MTSYKVLFLPAAILLSVLCLGSSMQNEFADMESKSRIWTDWRGQKITAKWKYVSQEGDSVWLLQDGKSKVMQIPFSRLSEDDRKYISNTVQISKKLGYKWIDGVYMSTNEIREMNYVKKARSLVKEKSPKNRISFRVFQPLEYGALCTIGEKHDWGGYSYNGPIFYWNVGVKGLVANEETYTDKRLYWAGTFSYKTKIGDSNTVLWYVEDFDRAVYLVRGNFGLFITGDPRFSKFDEPPKATQPIPHENPPMPTTWGTGFFISTNGFIATNHHVVRGKSNFMIKYLNDDIPAKLIAVDSHTDLAILKVDCGEFPALPFSKSKTANLGQDIFVMGFPLHQSQGFSPKVTKGVISSLTGIHDDPTTYQIDASIQPGNSGGPVCDVHGNLLAIVVSSLNDKFFLQHHDVIPQNVNYAIKKSYLMAFLSTIPACIPLSDEGAFDHHSLEDAVKYVRFCIVHITAR